MEGLENLDVEWVPVCPEEDGDLGTPRPAAEMQDSAKNILKGIGSVVDNNGIDVTVKFIRGAERSLKTGLTSGAEYAILKSRSPSCGVGKVYDGSFTNTLADGDGTFAHLCRKSGITCIPSDDFDKIKETLPKQK